MSLFLILFLCMVEIYSRLGGCKFPISSDKFPISMTTGIRRQAIDLRSHFRGQMAAAPGKLAKFPVRREKPGTLPVPEDWLPF